MTVGPLNHYQVLMLDPDVDADLLATVYRRLIQRYQSPLDKSGTALERLRAVDAAYAVLSDPHRRARYDAQLEERMRYAEDADWALPAAVAQPVSRPVPAPVSAPAPAPSECPRGVQPGHHHTPAGDSRRRSRGRSAHVVHEVGAGQRP